jgi:hypothetical protein
MRKLPGDSHSSSCAERTDLGAIGGYIRGGVTLASPRSGSGQTATWRAGEQMSGKDPEPDSRWPSWFVAYMPLADTPR